jgi:hypothetical protein
MALALTRGRSLALALCAAIAGCDARGNGVAPIVTARSQVAHAGAPHTAHVSEPALALAPDGTAHLAWIRGDDAGKRVETAALRDGAAPVRVDPDARPVANGHQPPGLAIGGDGRVHVSWSSPRRDPGGSAFAADLVLASSVDGGQSFAAPLALNEDEPGSRGFESIAVDARGEVVAAWIESGAKPGATTRAARVSGGSVAERAELGARTCPCCRVAVARDGAGGVGVLWRDELPGSVRDMAFAQSPGGPFAFAPGERVRDDGWVFAACPHRGGALAFAPDGRAIAVWYSEGRSGEPALWLAARGARGFAEPIAVHEGSGSQPDRVALAIGADGAGLVLWERRSPVRSEIAARAISARGQLGPVRVVSSGVHASGPAVAAAPEGGFVAAWNEEAFPTLHTVVARLTLRAER